MLTLLIASLNQFFFLVFGCISIEFVMVTGNPNLHERLLSSRNKTNSTQVYGDVVKRIQRDALVSAVVTGIIGREEGHVRVKKNAEPVIEAVVHGIIGMTAKAVSDLTAYRPYPSDGGCKWFGTAPFCNGHCQAEYDYIRNSNGRCSNWWFSGVCKPDPSFGEPCSTFFGGTFKKRFCCKSDPSECTWSGRWMGAFSAHNIYCRYDNHGHCGHLDCSVNHFTYQAQNDTDIVGYHCDQLFLFGLRGKATCGYIAWFDNDGILVDSWYKTK